MKWSKDAGYWESGEYMIIEDMGSAPFTLVVDPRNDGNPETVDFDTLAEAKAFAEEGRRPCQFVGGPECGGWIWALPRAVKVTLDGGHVYARDPDDDRFLYLWQRKEVME